MNKIENDYFALLQDIIDNGVKKQTRNGTTLSVFNRTLRHNFKDGFPLLTTKRMHLKGVFTELMWFLNGRTDLKYLIDRDCNIWNGDAYANYVKYTSANDATWNEWMHNNGDGTLRMYRQDEFIELIRNNEKFSKKWGNFGEIYGFNWVRFGEMQSHSDYDDIWPGINQIANLIKDLQNNPDSRRMLVTAWNPLTVNDCILPPCHIGFQCYTRELTFKERRDLARKYAEDNEKIPLAIDAHGDMGLPIYMDTIDNTGWNIPKRALSMSWTQRSCDIPLGWPYNISSYSLLLLMLCKQVNMVPEEIICNLGDTHIYTNQLDGIREQLSRTPYDLPTIRLTDRTVGNISEYKWEDIIIENYQFHPTIKIPLSN